MEITFFFVQTDVHRDVLHQAANCNTDTGMSVILLGYRVFQL